MKKIFFFLMVSLYGYSQNKCYCDLVENAGPLAKVVKETEGEFLATVGEGQELWVKMNPAAVKNTKENGGCRLKPGEQFVAKNDINGTLLPIRAWKCGNKIETYSFYQTTTPVGNIVVLDTSFKTGTTIVSAAAVNQTPQTTVIKGNRAQPTHTNSFRNEEVGVYGFTNQNVEGYSYTAVPTKTQVFERQTVLYQQQSQGQHSYVVQNPAYQTQVVNPSLYLVQKTKTNKMKWWHYGLAVVGGVVVGDLVTGGGLDFYGCFKKGGTNPGYIPGNTPKTPIDDRPPSGFVIPIGF